MSLRVVTTSPSFQPPNDFITGPAILSVSLEAKEGFEVTIRPHTSEVLTAETEVQWRRKEPNKLLEHVLFYFAAPAVPTSHKVVASPKHKFGLSFISEVSEFISSFYLF